MAKAKAHPNSPHKYLRIRVMGRGSVSTFRWRCVQPGCQHYLLEQFIVGAIAECWRCGKEFTIDKMMGSRMKPHCRECTRRKGEQELDLPLIEESPI